MSTGLLYSPRFLEHDTGPGHPERPERIQAIIDNLSETNLINRLTVINPEIRDPQLPQIVHDSAYLKRIALSCDRGDQYIDSFDNAISEESFQVALLAANAAAQGVDHIMETPENNAVVLPRPPGHHAEYSQAMGFCLFNNVAVAARYAQQKYSITKITIVDFDVHHGNGTQHLFEADPNILYTSIHRYPFYPGTGAKNETGRGDGLGKTVNYPLDQGRGNSEYLDLIDNSMAEKIIGFKPELLILSAGFDAHELDPLGGMVVSTDGFRKISQRLFKIGSECCSGRILSVLEGGYSLQGISESMNVHIQELLKE